MLHKHNTKQNIHTQSLTLDQILLGVVHGALILVMAFSAAKYILSVAKQILKILSYLKCFKR